MLVGVSLFASLPGVYAPAHALESGGREGGVALYPRFMDATGPGAASSKHPYRNPRRVLCRTIILLWVIGLVGPFVEGGKFLKVTFFA